MTTNLTPKQCASIEDFMLKMSSALGYRFQGAMARHQGSDGLAAYNDGKKVNVNLDKMDWSNPVRAWLQVKGLFYHELMHNVADPIPDYASALANGKSYLKTYLNVLGDQTGETRMANLYAGLRSYYALNVYEIILRTLGTGQTDDSRVYPLVYGRRSFLPKRFVKAARDAMLVKYGEHVVANVERIIDEYHRQASITKDTQVFVGLAEQLYNILGDKAPPQFEHITTGRMRQEARKADQQTEPSDPEPADPEPAEQQGNSKDDGDDDGDEDSDTDKDDDKDDDEQGDQQGKANGLLVQAEAEADEMLNGEMMSAGHAEAEELGLLPGVDTSDVDSHTLAEMLKRVQMQARSGYENGYRSGRLDIRKVVRSKGLRYDVFKQWHPDRRQATKLSVAVLIDRSGSMARHLDDANQAAATIGLACEEAGPVLNHVMVRYFSDSDMMTKKPEQKFGASSLVGQVGGGTDPWPSLREALRWLEREPGLKLLFCLTDSEWGQLGYGQDIKRSAAAGKVKVLVLHVGFVGRAGHGLPYANVQNVSTLADVVLKAVREAVAEQARKVLA